MESTSGRTISNGFMARGERTDAQLRPSVRPPPFRSEILTAPPSTYHTTRMRGEWQPSTAALQSSLVPQFAAEPDLDCIRATLILFGSGCAGLGLK